MSTVRAMTVSGIRSFGCDNDDRQKITFTRPLTLILGENGCGKTTLLESLKFALCDEFPPNADSGRSFVHDPTLHHSRESRAQIRLEFMDQKKTKYLVIRSMQTQMKQKKMQFQRLDNVLQTVDEKGDLTEISGRCVDINSTIASVLGVSKAILTNVIFCHQEDSNWPLEEGKKLKERFDAIFDTTKYNKMFEHVKKLRKEYAVKIKLLEMEVSNCSERKTEYQSKILKLSELKQKIEDGRTKLTEFQEALKPIQEKLAQIEITENNFVKLKSKLEIAKSGLQNCLKQQKELRSSIKNIRDDSEEIIRKEIESFVQNLSANEKSLNERLKSQKKLTESENNIEKGISNSRMKMSELTTLENQNKSKITKRYEELVKIAQFADIPSSNISEENALELFEMIQIKIQALQDDLKSLMKDSQNEEEKLQKNIDDCRDAFTKHKESISGKQRERNNLKNQEKKLENEISDANTSKSNLESLKTEMESSDKHFQDVSEQFNVAECEKTINDDETEIAQLEHVIDDLDKTINILQMRNSKQTELNVQKESLSNKQKMFAKIKNKNKDYMNELVGNDIPENNFKRTFQDLQRKLKNEVESMESEIKKQQKKLTTLETERIHKKDELDSKKNELTKGEEELYKLCKKQNLEDVLTKVSADINKLQDDKTELASSEFVIGRYVEKLKAPDPGCPLCHRSFDSENDVTELVSELQDKICNVPRDLQNVTSKLSKLVHERDQLVGMRSLNAKTKQLKNEEIPALEQKLNEIDDKLQNLRDTIDEYSISSAEPKNKLEVSEKLLSDMPYLDQLNQDMTNIKSEINKLESQLGSSETTMTLEEARSKHSETKQKIAELKSSVKSSQKKLKEHNAKLNSARDKKNKIKEKYLQAQAKVQELCSLQTRFEEITETRTKLESELSSLEEKSETYKKNLASAEEEKKTTMGNMRKNVDKQRQHINQLDKKFTAIIEFNKDIDKYNSENIPQQLENINRTIERLTSEKEEIVEKIKFEIDTINKIKDDLSNQNLNKRDLEDNLKLKVLEKEQEDFEDRVEVLNSKIGETNHKSLADEKEKLLRSQNDVIVKKASTEGEIKQLNESVKMIEMELKQRQFKDVNDRYRRKFYELQLTKMTDKDLKDYIVAMDCCLMKFHKEKMKKINVVIREMWRNIYRGNDVDYIEIKTDETNCQTGNRRVYDYRIVQYRNSVEIDMKGKCSAGQKVLASLIIRMALAETFSNRFGVLALDEPTTNLDRENVVSLCSALKDMIEMRMKFQNNFMFIIITHDTEFLTSLGSIDRSPFYYRVSRNREGKSVITKERMP